ncbi:MAG: DUF3019 domain-containing protein [Woeseiaceae bacterium]|nr:DUF3019 domain-containing protein [Woeseiaceae bacterium]
MRRYLALLLLSSALFAGTETRAEDLKLEVKPVLCITDNRNPSCEMGFLVVWQTVSTGYYCLFNDFGEAPVRCWDERREGRATDERTVQESFSYWMTGADLEARLAQVTVEVLHLDSDDRRRKRRTRHVWDIN